MYVTMFGNGKVFETRLGHTTTNGNERYHLEVFDASGQGSVTIVADPATILDLCEQVNQMQQEIMRCQEESQPTSSSGTAG